jgi:hypothetical protein
MLVTDGIGSHCIGQSAGSAFESSTSLLIGGQQDSRGNTGGRPWGFDALKVYQSKIMKVDSVVLTKRKWVSYFSCVLPLDEVRCCLLTLQPIVDALTSLPSATCSLTELARFLFTLPLFVYSAKSLGPNMVTPWELICNVALSLPWAPWEKWPPRGNWHICFLGAKLAPKHSILIEVAM